jgi:hypothetical protein
VWAGSDVDYRYLKLGKFPSKITAGRERERDKERERELGWKGGGRRERKGVRGRE